MFYICDKCKRRWQYPLTECPYCLIPLTAMAAKTARVAGAVKVAIPTLFHPNVPYYVLALEDELKNMWGYKTEIEYKVGDDFKVGINNDPNAVAIWRVKYNSKEAIGKVLELMGDVCVRDDSKIIILPTLTAPSHSYFCDNTSPEFLEAVLALLLERGAKIENIMVASQSFDDLPIGGLAQKSGLLAACQKFGIMPVDLATQEFEKIESLEIAKAVLDADLVINLAMEKMGQAAAAVNLFKVLKKENYLGQKYLSSDAEIAAKLELFLSKVLYKTITIGEAEYVQRSNKITTFMGLVLAGKSARNVDKVFNEAAKSIKAPETIKDIAIENIPVAGRTIREVQYQAEIF